MHEPNRGFNVYSPRCLVLPCCDVPEAFLPTPFDSGGMLRAHSRRHGRATPPRAAVGRVRDCRMRSKTIERVGGRGAAVGWIVLVVAVSLVLRWPFFGVPLNADEGGYAYVTQRWIDGRGDLYDDLWI